MAKRRTAARRTSRRFVSSAPARRPARRAARSGNRAQSLRIVVESAAPAPQFIPAHLGPGGGIVPVVAGPVATKKPRF